MSSCKELLGENCRQSASTRWLLPKDIESILLHHREMGFYIQSSPPSSPANGELYLFDRDKTKSFKQDGIDWAKRKGQSRTQETYQIIKIKGLIRLHGVYCRSASDPQFQKRFYRLANGSNILVLVHYRDVSVSEGSIDSVSLEPQDEHEILFCKRNGMPQFRDDEAMAALWDWTSQDIEDHQFDSNVDLPSSTTMRRQDPQNHQVGFTQFGPSLTFPDIDKLHSENIASMGDSRYDYSCQHFEFAPHPQIYQQYHTATSENMYSNIAGTDAKHANTYIANPYRNTPQLPPDTILSMPQPHRHLLAADIMQHQPNSSLPVSNISIPVVLHSQPVQLRSLQQNYPNYSNQFSGYQFQTICGDAAMNLSSFPTYPSSQFSYPPTHSHGDYAAAGPSPYFFSQPSARDDTQTNFQQWSGVGPPAHEVECTAERTTGSSDVTGRGGSGLQDSSFTSGHAVSTAVQPMPSVTGFEWPVHTGREANLTFTIVDFSPCSDSSTGGSKVLICVGAELPAQLRGCGCLQVAFGSALTAAEALTATVLRCHTPPWPTPSPASSVRVPITIITAQGQIISTPSDQLFEFFCRPEAAHLTMYADFSTPSHEANTGLGTLQHYDVESLGTFSPLSSIASSQDYNYVGVHGSAYETGSREGVAVGREVQDGVCVGRQVRQASHGATSTGGQGGDEFFTDINNSSRNSSQVNSLHASSVTLSMIPPPYKAEHSPSFTEEELRQSGLLSPFSLSSSSFDRAPDANELEYHQAITAVSAPMGTAASTVSAPLSVTTASSVTAASTVTAASSVTAAPMEFSTFPNKIMQQGPDSRHDSIRPASVPHERPAGAGSPLREHKIRVVERGAVSLLLPPLSGKRSADYAVSGDHRSPCTHTRDTAATGSSSYADGSEEAKGPVSDAADGKAGGRGAPSSEVGEEWLDEQQLTNLSPVDLEALMDRYLVTVVKQIVELSTDDDYEPDLDALDTNGFSLLHYCCMYNFTSLIPALLNKGASPMQASTSGSSPLHLAAAAGNHAAVDMLLEDLHHKGQRLEPHLRALDGSGSTPLNLARAGQYEGVCQSLIEATNVSEHFQVYRPVHLPSQPQQTHHNGFDSDVVALPQTDFVGVSLDRNLKSGQDVATSFSPKLLQDAVASLSLSDKCALSMAIARQNQRRKENARLQAVQPPLQSLLARDQTCSSSAGAGGVLSSHHALHIDTHSYAEQRPSWLSSGLLSSSSSPSSPSLPFSSVSATSRLGLAATAPASPGSIRRSHTAGDSQQESSEGPRMSRGERNGARLDSEFSEWNNLDEVTGGSFGMEVSAGGGGGRLEEMLCGDYSSDDESPSVSSDVSHCVSALASRRHPALNSSGSVAGSMAGSLSGSVACEDSDLDLDLDIDIQSVLSESDKESLDVVMRMMGELELSQVESEVRRIQNNVRGWLLRKNYSNLRQAAKTLQMAWRERSRTALGRREVPHTTSHADQLKPDDEHSRGSVPASGAVSVSGMWMADSETGLDCNFYGIINSNDSASLVDLDPGSMRVDPSHTEGNSCSATVNNMHGREPADGTEVYQESGSSDSAAAAAAAATLQAATRGMLARRNFAVARRQALASLVIQRGLMQWKHHRSGSHQSTSADDADSRNER